MDGKGSPYLIRMVEPDVILVSKQALILWSQLRLDYDPTTTYRARLLPIQGKQKMNMSIFRRSSIAVESNAYHNFDHFRHSRMRRGIVVS